MSDKRAESLVNAINGFATCIYDVAIVSQGTKPSWVVVNFVYSAFRNAIDLMPDGYEAEKDSLHRRCIEAMLILTLIAEEDTESALAARLFDELCRVGFTSEQRAINCIAHYCGWLKSRGEMVAVAEAIEKAGVHVTHPYFKDELRRIREPPSACDGQSTEGTTE